MGKLSTIVVAISVSLGTLHCTKKGSYAPKPAPTSEQALGLIVKTTESQLEELTKSYPSTEVRALSVKNGIYEVSYAPVAAVQNISSRPVYKNKFVQGLAKSEMPKTISLQNLAKNTSDDALDAINTCMDSPTAPGLDVDITFDVQTLTIELGEEVSLTALGTANETVGGDVRFMWDLLPPGFSQQSFTSGISGKQTFTPDSPGLYQIAVVAQGADLSCKLIVVPLFVTTNPEISSPVVVPTIDQTPFTHLGYVHAAEAWPLSKGTDVVVAILDTGVNYNHVGIRNNIIIKSSELLNDTDDDGNGFPDDTIGWDFVGGDRFPFDDQGHGSHVSGLVASPLNGLAPEAKILPVKVLNAGGGSDIATVVAGIYYAVDSGAQIINASLGFEDLPEVPQPMLDAIIYAREKNVLFLAAAGNGGAAGIGFDIKARPTYPASFQLDNLITVAATALNEITSYSNFSEELVHVAAPGGNEKEFVFSLATLNPANSPFAGQAGTSMATPVTVGVIALMLSANPQLSPLDVRNILMDTGTDLPSLKGKTASGRQVNAKEAVQRSLDLKLAASIM
jgi:subtilisin family serine protease